MMQDNRGDLSRGEIREEIEGLDPRQQAELVASMWVGRRDAAPARRRETTKAAPTRTRTAGASCRSLAPKWFAQFAFGTLEIAQATFGEVLSRPVDVEREHRHRRLV
jgi:hypothetical protein